MKARTIVKYSFTKEERDHLNGIRNYAQCEKMVCHDESITCEICPVRAIHEIIDNLNLDLIEVN